MLNSAQRPEIVLDRAAVREVDRAAVEDYGIPGIVLMENAARAIASEALNMLRAVGGSRSLVVCGGGNNGGDGWAAARHLTNAGAEPIVFPLDEPRAGSDAATNAAIARRMGVREVTSAPSTCDCEIIIDAVFGTGLTRHVEGRAAEVLEWINRQGKPVLAVDVPSGLDCDTGEPLAACVRATVTLTLVAMKPGLLRPQAKPFVGRVIVGDIGAPRKLIERLGAPRA